MLGVLRSHEIRWIMTGSTVLAAYSSDLCPNDLDVTPALDAQNLRRVAALLVELDALPMHNPNWDKGTVEQCYAWRPKPANEEQLDHLLVTRLGMLDIVPRLCGTYEELMQHAIRIDAFGYEILMCDPHEVLRKMPERPRRKDERRAAQLQEVRDRIAKGLGPIGLSRLG